MRRPTGWIARLTRLELIRFEPFRILPVVVFGAASGTVSRACAATAGRTLPSALSTATAARPVIGGMVSASAQKSLSQQQ
jgi:hypothetical protein